MFTDIEIKPREILASISIIAIMILFGILISGKISEVNMDNNEIYNKAVKIESAELFQYGMSTNVGNAFVYGDLDAIDTITYPEIGGEYIYVEKVKERYTKHTRYVTRTKTVNGVKKEYREEEEYWTWDAIDKETQQSKQIRFCNTIFASEKIELGASTQYLDMIKESSRIRYKYYGMGTHFTGTIFTDLRNNTISDNSQLYVNKTIEETVEYLETDYTVIFWVIWILLTMIVVFIFIASENVWLD